MLTVFTRPAFMSAHIVVLPTPTSLQAVLTGTANGRTPSGSPGAPEVRIVICSHLATGSPNYDERGWTRAIVGVLCACRYLSFVVICRQLHSRQFPT